MHARQAGGDRDKDRLGESRAQTQAELKVGQGGARLPWLSALLLFTLTFTFFTKPCCQLTNLKYIKINITTGFL